jgi:hypothetical protein
MTLAATIWVVATIRHTCNPEFGIIRLTLGEPPAEAYKCVPDFLGSLEGEDFGELSPARIRRGEPCEGVPEYLTGRSTGPTRLSLSKSSPPLHANRGDPAPSLILNS